MYFNVSILFLNKVLIEQMLDRNLNCIGKSKANQKQHFESNENQIIVKEDRSIN